MIQGNGLSHQRGRAVFHVWSLLVEVLWSHSYCKTDIQRGRISASTLLKLMELNQWTVSWLVGLEKHSGLSLYPGKIFFNP